MGTHGHAPNAGDAEWFNTLQDEARRVHAWAAQDWRAVQGGSAGANSGSEGARVAQVQAEDYLVTATIIARLAEQCAEAMQCASDLHSALRLNRLDALRKALGEPEDFNPDGRREG